MARSPPLKRIALLTGARMSGAAPGGTGAYVRGLARFLATSNIEPVLMSNGPVQDPPQGVVVRQLSITYLPSTGLFHRQLRKAAMGDALEGCGVLHLQRPDDLTALNEKTEMPATMCTLHGDAWKSIRRRHGVAALLLYRRLERRAMPRFRAIVAVDGVTASAYELRYPDLASKIAVIPNAVDPAWCAESLSSPPPHLPAQPTFLFAGRLSPEKQVGSIIDLFRTSGELRGAHLIVAGEGPEKGLLTRLAQGLSVEFLGAVGHDQMPALYRRVHALVLASDYEGMPTAALEALACGCPTAGLATCGLQADMSKDGVFVADSLESLPEAMRAAAARRSRDPSIRLSDTHTWPVAGARLLNLYRAIAPEAFG